MALPLATTPRIARTRGAALLLVLAISGGAHAAPDVHPVGDPLGRLLTDPAIANGASVVANVPVAASPVGAMPGSIANKIREQASDMVVTAMNFLGVKYRRGGNDADVGFDCSG